LTSSRANILAVAALSLLGPMAAGAAPEQRASPRLEGTWSVKVVYKVADGLVDRTVGERVSETWSFRPRCARDACAVELRRAGRPLLLRRLGAMYSGRGSFRGSFFCDGRTYPKGTAYVEEWTVRVTKSGPGPRGRRALAISGVGVTAGRSAADLPCPVVVSQEGVAFTGRVRKS
jgi:hypothetical protein